MVCAQYLMPSSTSPFFFSLQNEYLNQNKLNGDGGIIRSLYSPLDDQNIIEQDRVFYTNENALIIDNIRAMVNDVDEEYRKFFIAPLLYTASVHTNTSGVFKGFYKDKHTKIGKFGGTAENALTRIKGTIELPVPIFSNYECDVEIGFPQKPRFLTYRHVWFPNL